MPKAWEGDKKAGIILAIPPIADFRAQTRNSVKKQRHPS
jgi:hypothetical protein